MNESDRRLLDRLRERSVVSAELLDSAAELADRDEVALSTALQRLGAIGAGEDASTLVPPEAGFTICELGSSEVPPPPPSAALDFAPGEFLADYQLLEKLGEGGMGVVYRACHIELGRDVALKILTGGSLAGQQAAERFRREAAVIARLHHPNVIGIFEIREARGLVFFAMNLVRGGSLRRALSRGQVDLARGLEIVEALARGLAHVHEHGIVHRDVKPENVLLEPDGTPILTDFGLAHDEDSEEIRTRTGTVLGTPAYMAPEQAAGRTAGCGPWTDVYALGAVLYEIATGAPPFGRQASVAVLRRIVEEDPVRPRVLDRRIPRDLETIVLACLAKDPRRRYATAAALAEDLARYRAGEPIRARAVGPIERAIKRARRHRSLVATAAAGLLVAAAVGGVLGRRAWLEAEARDRAEADRRRLLEEAARSAQEDLERLTRRSRAMPSFERGRTIAEALGSVDRTIRAETAAEALRQLDRAIEADPGFAEAFHVRGRLREETREFDSALADHARAFELEPGHLAARYRWGLVQVLSKVDHAAGRSAFEAIAAADPGSAWADLGRAFVAIFEERWDEAETLAEAAASKNAYLSDAWFELAYVRQQRSDLVPEPDRTRLREASEAAYTRAIALRPGDAWSHGNRGIVRDLLGRAEGARADYDAAIELDPTFSSAWLNRAILRQAQGDLEGAIADLDRSIELNGESVRAWTARGTFLLSAGRTDEAAADLERARALEPEDPYVVHQLARLARARGDATGATSLFREALRLAGGNVDLVVASIDALAAGLGAADLIALLDSLDEAARRIPRVLERRAHALAALGRVDESLAAHDELLRLEPTPSRHQVRSQWLERAGRIEAARADLDAILDRWGGEGAPPATTRTALAILSQFCARHERYHEDALAAARRIPAVDPSYAYADFLEGRALWLLDRPAEALVAFERYVERVPDDPDGHENRGGVLLQLGRRDEGVAALRRSLELDPSPERKRRLGPRAGG